MYSHIPGGLAALPKFDEGSDFKIPANVVKGESSPIMLMDLTLRDMSMSRHVLSQS